LDSSLRRSVGAALVIGALLVNVPYTLLVVTFDYPDVLRAPAMEVLTRFQAGGPRLIAVWAAFAWVGAPLLHALPNLPRALSGAQPSALATTATTLGVVGLVVQIVGLLRWVFVVPVLALLVTDPATPEATRTAALVAFQVVHAYGGVALGEHLGQALTITWTAALSVELLRTGAAPRWIGGLGLAAAALYALAQGELVGTVVPGFPQWGAAGLVGSLAWLAFLIALGANLLRAPGPDTRPA